MHIPPATWMQIFGTTAPLNSGLSEVFTEIPVHKALKPCKNNTTNMGMIEGLGLILDKGWNKRETN